jgi:hypothetical protein
VTLIEFRVDLGGKTNISARNSISVTGIVAGMETEFDQRHSPNGRHTSAGDPRETEIGARFQF